MIDRQAKCGETQHREWGDQCAGSGMEVVNFNSSIANAPETSVSGADADQLLIDPVITGDVGHRILMQIIHFAGHAIKFDDLGNFAHRFGEPLQPFGRVFARAHHHEHGGAGAQLDGVEQRHALEDIAAFLELADAAPAGILGEVNRLGDLADRAFGIFLQQGQNSQVCPIQACQSWYNFPQINLIAIVLWEQIRRKVQYITRGIESGIWPCLRGFLSPIPNPSGRAISSISASLFPSPGTLLLAGFACLLHAVIPGLCERTASRRIEILHDRMVANRRRHAVPAVPSPEQVADAISWNPEATI